MPEHEVINFVKDFILARLAKWIKHPFRTHKKGSHKGIGINMKRYVLEWIERPFVPAAVAEMQDILKFAATHTIGIGTPVGRERPKLTGTWPVCYRNIAYCAMHSRVGVGSGQAKLRAVADLAYVALQRVI